MTIVLALDGVRKSFGGVRAVEDVSLELAQGEIHGLIGPNGAGKTTIVNIASGICTPDAGTVHLRGRDVTHVPPYARARLGLGRTYQHAKLFEEMSVLENVVVGLEGVRTGTHGVVSEALALLDGLGMREFAEIPAFELPHGKRKLLEVARAAERDCVALLLDEPASGLAPSEIAAMLDLVRARRHGRGVMVIEHNMDVIMNACDRVTVIDSGRWLATGTPEEIAGNTDVARAYLGLT